MCLDSVIMCFLVRIVNTIAVSLVCYVLVRMCALVTTVIHTYCMP